MSDENQVHAIVLSDVEGIIQFWSEGCTQLFGYTAAEAVGRTLDIIVPEAHRERHWKGYRQVVKAAPAPSGGATTNLPVLCKDGSVRPFPARFMFLHDARNQIVGALSIYSTPQGSEKPFGAIVNA